MKTYVALLRGINVGGHKKIRMTDLRAHLEELGWEGIQTYIQSGNIIFRSTDDNPRPESCRSRNRPMNNLFLTVKLSSYIIRLGMAGP